MLQEILMEAEADDAIQLATAGNEMSSFAGAEMVRGGGGGGAAGSYLPPAQADGATSAFIDDVDVERIIAEQLQEFGIRLDDMATAAPAKPDAPGQAAIVDMSEI